MRKIAIWVHGGVGGGHFSQGQPPVQDLIGRLSTHFELEVYSLRSPNNDFSAATYRIIYPGGRKGRLAGWLWLIRRFIANHRKSPYDIVYGIWGYPAGSLAVIAARIMGLPSIVHLQGGDATRLPALSYGVFDNPLRALICRITYRLCSRLVALSVFQSESLRRNGIHRLPTIVSYGPDLKKFDFRPATFDKPLLRFLHVGNQTPVKGQEVMLRTFALVRAHMPSQLSIVGDDYYNGKLRTWCKEMGIEGDVEFMGPQPHVAMPEFYHNSDILLHTPWYEGQGMVFAEAAACGTLIAGTRVGMLSDMGDDCGLVVSAGDARGLASKIVDAVNSKDHIRQMIHSAHDWVRKKDVTYTERTMVRILEDLIAHECSESSQKPTQESQR